MNRPPNRRRLLLALALCVAPLAGCAGLPRIDPSGEQILIFPGETPPVAPGQTSPVVVTPQPAVDPFTGLPPITPPAGNPIAPPVLPQGSPGLLGGLFNEPTIIGPAVGTPVIGQPVAATGDRVTLTPERVLAPVGSEVVLRAAICGADGFQINNRRIEWNLDQQGVGQFVTLGDRGQGEVLRWPWERPDKVDSHYAIGYTTPFHTCLRRNAADPADDVQIVPGDAWISVSSPVEGASHVTAFAPSVGDWAARKASTVIYWVDAQWSLPPSTTVPAGQPHTLTTTVTRQSDGTPIAGWTVRYEVADGAAARLGYEAGQVAEAVTDSQGRASVEINPTDDQPGTSTVNVTIVRPAQPAPTASPQINVGSGQATITWASDTPATGLPPITPTEPDPVFEPPIDTGPITPAPAGRPDLDVRLRRDTPDPIRVGDTVAYTILVRNNGDGPARNIVITDEFDRGLSNEFDTTGRSRVVYEGMSDLGPSGSGSDADSVRLEFQVLEPGQRRHSVTVTADGATEAFDRDAFEALPIEPVRPDLRVELTSDLQRVEGENTELRGVIENRGSTDATNVVVRMRFDGASLNPEKATPAREGERFTDLQDLDTFEWVIPRIASGETRALGMLCNCLQSTRAACVVMTVTADGGVNEATEKCVEILPRIGESPAEGGAAPPAGAATGLTLSIASTANPARIGSTAALQIFFGNAGPPPETQVVIEVALPPAIRPRMDTIQGPTRANQLANGVIQFEPIATLAPGARDSILIQYDPQTEGRFQPRVRIRSAETPLGVEREDSIEVAPQ